ncbi:MAG: hypothetical protein K0R09_3582 [Clostridiales bacterium]|nr:hypothetical protein [Clostridiales bacterium]
MGKEILIGMVKACMANVIHSDISQSTCLEFVETGNKVIEELKAMNKPKEGAVVNVNTQD